MKRLEVRSQTNRNQKVLGIIDPFLLESLPDIVSRWNKVLNLHLFKLPSPENKVSRGNLIYLSNLRWDEDDEQISYEKEVQYSNRS